MGKPITYNVTQIGVPSTYPTAINDRGEVVGNYDVNAGPNEQESEFRGFIYDHGTFTPVGPPPQDTNVANPEDVRMELVDVNAHGAVLGDYVSGTSAGTQTFVDEDGTSTNINLPTGDYGVGAVGINNAGEVIGNYEGFATVNGVPSDNFSNFGFLYDKGTVTPLIPTGAFSSNPFAINNHGEVYGLYADANHDLHLFLYDKGIYTTLNPPGSTGVAFYGSAPGINSINDRGEVVGSYAPVSGAASSRLLRSASYTTKATTPRLPCRVPTTPCCSESTIAATSSDTAPSLSLRTALERTSSITTASSTMCRARL